MAPGEQDRLYARLLQGIYGVVRTECPLLTTETVNCIIPALVTYLARVIARTDNPAGAIAKVNERLPPMVAHYVDSGVDRHSGRRGPIPTPLSWDRPRRPLLDPRYRA